MGRVSCDLCYECVGNTGEDSTEVGDDCMTRRTMVEKEELMFEKFLPWIPTRTGTRGSKPGIGGLEAKKAGIKDGEVSNWEFSTDIDPPEEMKSDMMSKVIELIVKACWSLQLYQFGGQTFLQTDGGPIGNRLTMACARVVMIMW